jgi:hypothetical protein
MDEDKYGEKDNVPDEVITFQVTVANCSIC